MSMASYIDIQLPARDRKISIARGELSYLSPGKETEEIITSLLGSSRKLSVKATLDGKSSDNRLRIGYLTDAMQLNEDCTVNENVEMYLGTVGKRRLTVNSDYILTKYNLTSSKKMDELTAEEKFILKIALVLSKEPEVLIVDNPRVQAAEQAYLSIMDTLYQQIIDKGLTCLMVLDNTSLIDHFPGRIINY